MTISAPKGTKDVLPNQVHKWRYVESVFREICETYGFREIRTPVFEHTELFKRGVGETTDVVEKQMYTFEDNGKRSVTLRPEGTAPVVRAFIENKLYADAQINKYYYIIPCFRYEKPQSGRQRQFHQFGVEIFGTDNPIADAETIGVAMDLFSRLGLKELELRINSIGCINCRSKYRENLQDFLRPKYDELCDTCKGRFDRNPMRILDCKSEICQKLVEGAPRMLDFICEDCASDFEKLKKSLTDMGFDYIVDSGIVRGLDYYTKTAYEIVTNQIGAQGTVCGGGRYDGLIEQLGGPAQTGVGFGLGIERLLMVMENCGSSVQDVRDTDVFVSYMDERAGVYGLKLMQELRHAGIKVQIDLLERNLKNQLKYADKLGAYYTVIIGEDEMDKGVVTIKDMRAQTQKGVGMENVVVYLKNKIGEL